jgi:hypothetical protein
MNRWETRGVYLNVDIPTVIGGVYMSATMYVLGDLKQLKDNLYNGPYR